MHPYVADIPTLLGPRGLWLLVAFGVMGLSVSTHSPVSARSKERLTFCYLCAILVWWYVFQFRLTSLEPGVHYRLGPVSGYIWLMHSAICHAFGIAFSLRIARFSQGLHRAAGYAFMGLYVFLLLENESLRPPLTK